MDCSDVDKMLSAGMSLDDLMAQAGSHVRTCPRCGPLIEILHEPLAVPINESGIRKRIMRRISNHLEPAKVVGSTTRVALGIVGAASTTWLLWTLLMGIPGFGKLDHMKRLALTVYSFVLLVLLSISLARLIRPAAPKPISPIVLLTGVMVGYPVLASLLYPVAPPTDEFIAEGSVCLMFGLVTALISGSLIWAVGRRGYVLNGLLAGAILGALAGLTGILALQWICPDIDGGHIAIWHGLTGVLSVLGGLGAGYLASRRESKLVSH